MATQTSNLPSVTRSLHALGETFNLRRKTPRSMRLGDELIDTTALVIEERTVGRQQDVNNEGLRPLKERTLALKRRRNLDPRILIATHTMLDPDQIRGQTYVKADEAVMAAGLDEQTKLKVGYAEESGRNFYDLGPDGEAATHALLTEVQDRAAADAEKVG